MLETTLLYNQTLIVNSAALLTQAQPCIYVHLISGAVEVTQADSVRVNPETVDVFDGAHQVGQFPAPVTSSSAAASISHPSPSTS